MFNAKYRCKPIRDFYDYMNDFDTELTLKNKDTGEIITVDAAALLAGMQMGLVVAEGIFINGGKLSNSASMALLVSAISDASSLYLSRLDKRAASESSSKEADVVTHV